MGNGMTKRPRAVDRRPGCGLPVSASWPKDHLGGRTAAVVKVVESDYPLGERSLLVPVEATQRPVRNFDGAQVTSQALSSQEKTFLTAYVSRRLKAVDLDYYHKPAICLLET